MITLVAAVAGVG